MAGSPSALARVGLLVGSLAVSLLAAEAAISLFLPPGDRYYVWPPLLRATFHPMPGVMPGVEGPARFHTNTWGLRGTEPEAAGDAWRVLTVGGSTTECMFLDRGESWPSVLERRLGASTGRSVWVGNAGRSGRTSREHRLQAEHLFSQPGLELDAAIVLAGVNDLTIPLRRGTSFRVLEEAPAEELATVRERAFEATLRDGEGTWERLGLWRLGRTLLREPAPAPAPIYREKMSGRNYVIRRRLRSQAKHLLEDLPPLDEALAEYRANIEAIVDEALAAGVRPILMTQPSLWRDGLDRDARALLWLGWVGALEDPPDTYYSVAALARGMKRYNDVLLDVCRSRGVECIDLAAAIQPSIRNFYDDVHFNERGSRRVAEVVLEHLTSRPPFAPAP